MRRGREGGRGWSRLEFFFAPLSRYRHRRAPAELPPSMARGHLRRVTPYKPGSNCPDSAVGPGLQGPSYLHGHRDLESFIMWGIRQMSLSMQQALFQHWANLPDWAIGSMCSGTDAPVLVCRAFVSAMATLSGKTATRLLHIFSCESDDRKRAFI